MTDRDPSDPSQGKAPRTRSGRKASKEAADAGAEPRRDPWAKARERAAALGDEGKSGEEKPRRENRRPEGRPGERQERPSRDRPPRDRDGEARRRTDRSDGPRFDRRSPPRRSGGPSWAPAGDRRGPSRGRDEGRGPGSDRDDRRGPSRGRDEGRGPSRDRDDRTSRPPRRDDRPRDRRDSRDRPRDDRRPDKPFPYGETHGPREGRRRDDAPKDPVQVRAGARLSEVEELELKVEKLVYGGDGMARFEGIPIFIPRSAPGDLLRVKLTDRKLGYGRGEIVDILEPGPGRREAPCPHFDACGGCDLQHLDDPTQLRAKAESVVETLRRLGGIRAPEKFSVVAGDPFGYRLRTQLHLAETERGLRAGYFARGTHDLVPVEQCPVLVPQLEKQLPDLPRQVEGATHTRIDLAAGDDGQWAVAPPYGDLPTGEITVRRGGFDYTYDARCFFQGHSGLVEDLLQHAIGDEQDPEGEAYDLFGGVGLFSLPLGKRYGRVVSVEGDRVAARFAKRNAKNNRVSNVEVVTQSVESWIEHLPKYASRVLVDPPRVGLSDKVRRTLMARRPKLLTYVSCEPPTLARDLKDLTRRLYAVESLTLLDMFPQTGHMEAVVQLRLAIED